LVAGEYGLSGGEREAVATWRRAAKSLWLRREVPFPAKTNPARGQFLLSPRPAIGLVLDRASKNEPPERKTPLSGGP